MIIVELEGKEYSLPEGWHEVSLEMFEKIVSHTNVLSEYKSQFQYAIEMFAILTKCSVDDLKKMTRGSFEQLTSAVKWTSEEITNDTKEFFEIEGEEYMKIKNLNSLEMGDVVSLEILISNSQAFEILTNILPILIRKVKTVQKANGEIKKVPMPFDDINYEETKQLFRKHIMVSEVHELKNFF